VLEILAEEDWSRPLFANKGGKHSVKSGIMLALDGVVVQDWDAGQVRVVDGSQLRFVPFVAGG
jgi:hypothetical protein